MFRRAMLGLFILFIVGLGVFVPSGGDSGPPEVFENSSSLTDFNERGGLSDINESDEAEIVGWEETIETVHENGSVELAESDYPPASLLNVSIVGYESEPEFEGRDEVCMSLVTDDVTEYIEDNVVGAEVVAVYVEDDDAWRLYPLQGGPTVSAELVERGYAMYTGEQNESVEMMEEAQRMDRGVWTCASDG